MLLLFGGHAEAHANIVQSEPPAGALLQTAPKEIQLEFSEDLDPGFSRVQLLGSEGQVVAPGPGVIDRAAPKVLRLALSDLPNDSYTALWRVRSAVDGHVTEGNLPFGVGVASSAVSLLPAADAPDAATMPPPPLESTARWLTLIAVAMMLGSLPFGVLVWRPAVRANRATDYAAHNGGREAGQTTASAMRRLVLFGGAGVLVTSLLLLIAQAATAAGVSLAQALGAPVVQLLSDRTGQLVLARVVLTLLLMLIAWRMPPLGKGMNWHWWLALLLGGALLLTWSLGSHSAAAEQNTALAVALDWLHLAAMVVWLGGLVPLVLAIRAARRHPEQAVSLASLVPRFSRLAIACIVVLTLTGLYSYVQNINQLSLLPATTYGRALLIKLALFCVLVLLGAVNLLALSPRLRTASSRWSRAIGRTVRLEIALGALVLLAVGVMTSVAPSKAAWAEHERQGTTETANIDGVDLTLRITPAHVGSNAFAVAVHDPRPNATDAATKMLLRFSSLDMNMGTLEAVAAPVDGHGYVAQGAYISMDGRWQIEVILRRAGFEDVRHTFEIHVGRDA
jgi:copper transport protein